MNLKWLILSGASRSGTTFLNVLLNTHPDVALFTETGIDNLIAAIEKCLATGNIASSSRALPMADVPSRDSIDAIAKSLYELQFKKRDLKVIGDKMPNLDDGILAKYTNLIEGLKKIYIVRKPAAVILSSMRRRAYTLIGADTWHISSVDEAIVEWALNWEHIARASKDVDTLVVAYERFEDDAEAEITKISDFLELDKAGFSGDAFARDGENQSRLSHDDARTIDNVLGPVDALLPHDLEKALCSMPLVFPKIELDMDVPANNTWPCAALFFKSGFSLLEPWGVWTDGHEASMGFRVDRRVKRASVSLHLTAFTGTRSNFDLHIRSSHQDTYKIFRIKPSENRYTAEIECFPSDHGVVQIHLYMPLTKSAEDEPAYDPRSLGIGLFHFRATATETASSACLSDDVPPAAERPHIAPI